MKPNQNKLKVAIIGMGNIGKVLAENLTKGNRAVIIANRDFEKAQSLASNLGQLASPMEVEAAIKEADIIIMAVWFNTIKDLVIQYASELKGKIVIDPSNPIALDEKGGFAKIIGEKESAGRILNSMLPMEAKFAKAFGTLGAASLSQAAHQKPEQFALFYTTDDISINEDIEELIIDSGFAPAYIGGIDQSIRIEVFGDLHEFGGLGKVPTLTEAEKHIYAAS